MTKFEFKNSESALPILTSFAWIALILVIISVGAILFLNFISLIRYTISQAKNTSTSIMLDIKTPYTIHTTANCTVSFSNIEYGDNSTWYYVTHEKPYPYPLTANQTYILQFNK